MPKVYIEKYIQFLILFFFSEKSLGFLIQWSVEKNSQTQQRVYKEKQNCRTEH